MWRKFSTSLITREIQIETIMRYHLIPVRNGYYKIINKHKSISVSENVENWNTVEGNFKWCSSTGKYVLSFSTLVCGQYRIITWVQENTHKKDQAFEFARALLLLIYIENFFFFLQLSAHYLVSPDLWFWNIITDLQ